MLLHSFFVIIILTLFSGIDKSDILMIGGWGGGVLFSLHSFFYTFLSSGTDKSDGNVDDTRIGICILCLIFVCVTFLDLT